MINTFLFRVCSLECGRSLFLAVLLLGFIVSLPVPSIAQQRSIGQNPALNNLSHQEGYKTGVLGELGKVTKVGSGPRDLILVAGAGFGGEIWDGFMSSRMDKYTMYAVTLPGYGNTAAPPMPVSGTSYGEQTWISGARKGILELIKNKNLKKPVVVAHWSLAAEVALGFALEHPEKVSKVIIISGIAKNVFADRQIGRELTRKDRITYVDQGMAPQWFKTVTRETWDDNNWFPSDYSANPVRAMQLWRMAFAPPLSVHVRYLCESWAGDVTENIEGLEVPTLVVKPGLDAAYDAIPDQRGGLRTLTHDSWKGVEKKTRFITLHTIEDSRAFIMDDQPEKLNVLVEQFLNGDVIKNENESEATDK